MDRVRSRGIGGCGIGRGMNHYWGPEFPLTQCPCQNEQGAPRSPLKCIMEQVENFPHAITYPTLCACECHKNISSEYHE
jgi:hypothetical protein